MQVEDQHKSSQGLTIKELTVGQSYKKSFVITGEALVKPPPE